MINTIWGSNQKPASTRRLSNLLSEDAELTGDFYVGYPVLGTPEGAFPFDAVLLSPNNGIVVFDIVEGKDAGDYETRQDDLFSKLQSKLLQYRDLVDKRTLLPKISICTYAPLVNSVELNLSYPLLNDGNFSEFSATLPKEDPQIFPRVAAAIQALTNIRKGRRRSANHIEGSRGAKLFSLNESIANLDSDQSAAVVETVDGVQRIRGLAGSGKTIVLALKVAYLHAQNPDWDIAVTFNTRSLKGQFERLINSFVLEQTNEEPDWKKIRIIHSWGSPSAPGVYYNFTKDNALTFRDFGTARNRYGSGAEFDGACKEALSETIDVRETYDMILIDEAQDLPSSFLQLCFRSIREPKRLVYAYDELQSLTNSAVPGPEELFGKGPDNLPIVEFGLNEPGEPRQDIILKTCYRNSRPVLATAHGLGFGIYREPGGLIQIFEQNDLWEDVGYRVQNGSLQDGEFVSLERSPETSPLFLESHSQIEDLIQFHAFSSKAEQDAWLVAQIEMNITQEGLGPEDIVVINPDPLSTRRVVGDPRAMLLTKGINSSIAGVSGSPDVFFEDDTVTFTGIFRAKGNEAGMVYVINAQDCYDSPYKPHLATLRNRLFTAITRSKAWVRVVGYGPMMQALQAEFARIKQHNFRLEFQYPNEEQKKLLRIVNRDLTAAERRNRKRRLTALEKALSALDGDDLFSGDVPPSIRAKLRAVLGNDETN